MPFVIERLLSESSTTRVHKAFDETLHRPVLLKVLHKYLANDEELRARFVREARACAALRSPHIVQVYDLTEIEGAPAIVMEYVEGRSLKEHIADAANRSPELARRTAEQVLRALAVAHGKNIIHRDIKPGNIMLASDGAIKVTDFGLARISASPVVTRDGALLGTPAYLPPELIRGEDPDDRSDLFSLGATLVEILSGERIFEGASFAECLQKINSFNADALDRFVQMDESSSKELIEFIKKLMHPDREQRFSSAEEALKALGIGNEKVLVEGMAAPNRKKRTFPILVLSLAAGAAAILFGLYAFVHTARIPVDTSLPEENPVTMADTARAAETQILSDDFAPNTTDRKKSPAVAASGTEARKEPALPTTPEFPDSVLAKITATPWAKVFINNVLIGETPLESPVYLQKGAHTVLFTHPSFEPMVKNITVASGKPLNIHADFLERAGYLFCTVRPWAEIYVNDVYKGTTPLSGAIVLSAGKHRLRFSHPSFADIHREVTIVARDTLKLSLSFAR